MGFDVARFRGEVDEELICPICSGVLEEAVQTPQCEHTFCKSCINEWLSRQHSCPVDRHPITPTDLKPAPRILRNLLARLEILCSYSSLGCTDVVKLDLLDSHVQECEFNPKKTITCTKGCQMVFPKDEQAEHNCVKELRKLTSTLQIEVSQLNAQVVDLKKELSVLNTAVQDCRRFYRHSNNFHSVGEVAEQDEVLQWSNSLPRARVTRWGGMISTPDSVLQALVKRALNESGCPPHIAEELMENAHERRWPSGLSNLETRQTNRRTYDKYVCKRIPGKQAVVVMASDNAHMNQDMVLQPGLVMIFAHGIE